MIVNSWAGQFIPRAFGRLRPGGSPCAGQKLCRDLTSQNLAERELPCSYGKRGPPSTGNPRTP